MDRTKAVISTYIRGIAFKTKIITLVIQIFFIFFYGYLIYKNIDILYLVIIYGCIALVGILLIIYDLFNLDLRTNKEVDDKRSTIRVFKNINWLLKLGVIGFTIYQFMNGKLTEFSLLMLIISIIALLAQIIIDVYSRYTIEHYILLFAAISKDYENAGSAVKTAIEAVDLNSIAKDVIEGRDGTTERLETLNYEYHIYSLLDEMNKYKHKITLGNRAIKRRIVRKYFERNFKDAEKYVKNIDIYKEEIESIIQSISLKIDIFPDEYNGIPNMIIYSKEELMLLLFFARNMIDKVYDGLNESSNILIISTLLYMNNDRKRLIKKLRNIINDDSYLFVHVTIDLILQELSLKKWRNKNINNTTGYVVVLGKKYTIDISNVIFIIEKLEKIKDKDKKDIKKLLVQNIGNDIGKGFKNKMQDLKNKIFHR